MLGFNPNYMSNPLFHLGLGLMSVPSRSTNPADVSWGPGLTRGLLSYQQGLLQHDAAQERALRTQLAQRKLAMEEARMQREQEMTQRMMEAQNRLRGSLDPDQQLAYDAMGRQARGQYAAGLLAPAEMEGPAGFKAWRRDNPEGTFEDYLRVKASIDPASRADNITFAPTLSTGGPKMETPEGRLMSDLMRAQSFASQYRERGEPVPPSLQRGIDNLQAQLQKLPRKQEGEDVKAADERRRAQQKLDTKAEGAQDLLNELEEAKGLVNAWSTGTLGAMLQIVPGSEAQTLRNRLSPVVSRITLDAMDRARETSKTGSTGFGALSQKELQVLQESQGVLAVSQDPNELLRAMNRVQASYRRIIELQKKERVRLARQSGGGGSQQGDKFMIWDPDSQSLVPEQ